MSISKRGQAILAGVSTEFGGNGYTHETMEVVVTDSMCNGSLLVGALEATVAEIATVDGILDDPKFPMVGTAGQPEAGQTLDFFSVGDTVMVRVAKNNVIANGAVINFSDANYADEALAILDGKGVKVQSAVAEFDYR